MKEEKKHEENGTQPKATDKKAAQMTAFERI